MALRGGHESSCRWCPGWCPPEFNLCGIWELLELSLSFSFYLLPGAKSGFKEGRDGVGGSKRALRAWSSRPIFLKYQHLSGAWVCNGLLVLEERMVKG